ncbi:hypothetical protein JR316_0010342 [Psilocybe cubensis]|uniref:Uncharacterized protein n=1 Tax=Psilocybe cubensis TaxID=181762 RepID=A0ACB8GR93_PSICU|nr:hypothetical protein JR316_0010342 [Psilocybe cubensis]KAH9478104.1 hypothetical protein JR316_0010342 [Psilocybe cubensis]
MPSSLHLPDLYVPEISHNTNLGVLNDEPNKNAQSTPLEAAGAHLAGSSIIPSQASKFHFCPKVLASIKKLTEDVEEEMGVNYLDLVKMPEASGAGIYNAWTSTSQPVPLVLPTSNSIQQSMPEEIEDSYDPRNGFEPPAATAAIPTQMSTFPELINSHNMTSLSRRRDVEISASLSTPAGPSRWHREERAYGEPIQPSIDWSEWLEHEVEAPSLYPKHSEFTGFPTHNTLSDAFNGSSYQRNNGMNDLAPWSTKRPLPISSFASLIPELNTAPMHNANGDEISSSPTPYGRTADAAQYQGMFYDHAQPWFQAGEGSNTHHPSTSFSSEREKKEIITSGSIKDGHEELRSRLTSEPVERQDINEAQTNDGGLRTHKGKNAFRDKITSRKRRREDTNSEIESAGDPRLPIKPKVQESRDTVPGDISTEVQGSRGKPRKLNPRAPAMMRSYTHNLTPLTTPEAKEGGFVPLVTAEEKTADKEFGDHQMPVSMDNITME